MELSLQQLTLTDRKTSLTSSTENLHRRLKSLSVAEPDQQRNEQQHDDQRNEQQHDNQQRNKQQHDDQQRNEQQHHNHQHELEDEEI